MLVVELHAIRAQPRERRLEVGAHLLAELFPHRASVDAELRGDCDLVTNRGQSAADQLLVGAGGVPLGGVEEGAAEIERLAHQLDRLALADPRSIAVAEPHGPEPDGRQLEAPDL